MKGKDKRGEKKQRWDSFGRRLKKLKLIGSKRKSTNRKFKDDTELVMIDGRFSNSSSSTNTSNENATPQLQQMGEVSRRLARTHSL